MSPAFVIATLFAVVISPVPDWSFPGVGTPASTSRSTDSAVVGLPGSKVVFHQSELDEMTDAVDWFPDRHPLAPGAVLHATGEGTLACGYCHLADGRGRPENASLRGLPREYIVEQVNSFANGERRSASPTYAPAIYMARAAHAVSSSDLEAAADYFSHFEPQAHTRIVEADAIPSALAWHFVYRFDPATREPLGERIVEGPTNVRRFSLRDPRTAYIAYVPLGSIKRGQGIAEKGLPGVPACVGCHGSALAGIAGASPSYLARQLLGFRNKMRNDPSAPPMQAVAADLTNAQIIDIAAFVASRRSWRLKDSPAN